VGALDIMNWLKIYDYKNLDGFLRSLKGQGGLGEAILRMLVAHIISAIPSLLILFAYVFLISGMAALSGAQGLALASFIGGIGVAGVVALFVIGLVVSVVSFLLNNGFIHVIAGLLGGRGSYTNLCHLISYISAASAIGTLVFMAVGLAGTIIPCISCILLIAELAWAIYMIYAQFKTIQVNYELSSGRAIATILIQMAFWMVVAFVIFAIILALGIISISSLASLGRYGSGSILQ